MAHSIAVWKNTPDTWSIEEQDLTTFVNKFLVKSSNQVKNLSELGEWSNIGVTDTPNALNFENFGMDDILSITQEKWAELQDPVEIYTWTDNPDFTDVNLTFSREELVTPTTEITIPDKRIRFLISKGLKSYSFIGNTWVEVAENEISSKGMTPEAVELLTIEQWGELFPKSAYKDELKITMFLAGVYDQPMVKSLQMDFVPNDPPIIVEAEIVPDNVHNEYAVLNANVEDYEGDTFKFKALIKKAGELEFVQVHPQAGGWDERGTVTDIFLAYNFPYFNIGNNEIKLLVEDQRGSQTEWLGNITLSNTTPTIQITFDDTQMTAVMGDEDGDNIAYRLFINEEMLFDFTGFTSSPTELKYLFDTSKFTFGEMNTVRLEVKDTFGALVSEEIQVLGTYRGLMFKNPQGDYFVDDRGNILMDLLFDGVLIAGQTSPTKEIILENRNGFAIKDTKVYAREKNFVKGATVEISETEMPFVPIDIVKIAGSMANLSTKNLYVRIVTDRTAHKGDYFHIEAKGEPV